MKFSTTELERIIDNAFNAGEIESQITEQESKLAKQQILSEHEIVERLKSEYLICDKESDTYCTPVGWDNISIGDSVAEILATIIVGCNHDKWHRGSLCDNCRVKIKSMFEVKNENSN